MWLVQHVKNGCYGNFKRLEETVEQSKSQRGMNQQLLKEKHHRVKLLGRGIPLPVRARANEHARSDRCAR